VTLTANKGTPQEVSAATVTGRRPCSVARLWPIVVLAAVSLALAVILVARATLPPGTLTMQLSGRGDMVYVPDGPCILGAPEGTGHLLEFRPYEQVNVPGFYIDRDVVTNQQYDLFVTTFRVAPPAHWLGGRYPPGSAKFPVFGINHRMASAYAAWVGKRLPTEVEWEKAARGTDGRLFPWGDRDKGPSAVTLRGMYHRPIRSDTADVSPFGVYDLVTLGPQWTSSPFNMLPVAAPQSRLLVIRGHYDCRSRNALHPNMVVLKSGNPILLRCAADVPPGP